MHRRVGVLMDPIEKLTTKRIRPSPCCGPPEIMVGPFSAEQQDLYSAAGETRVLLGRYRFSRTPVVGINWTLDQTGGWPTSTSC